MPSTITWLAPESGDWDTAANWVGGKVPGFNDTAVIPFHGITVTHASAAADTIQSLNTEAAVDISAGSLSIVGLQSRLDALVTVNGGTLSFFNNVTGTGTLRNFASLNLGIDISEQATGNANVAVDNEAGVLAVFGVINNDANRPFVNGPNATLRVTPGFPGDSANFTNGFTNEGHIEGTGTLGVANGILTNAPSGTIVNGNVEANLDNQGTIMNCRIGRAGGTVTNEGTIVNGDVFGSSFEQGGTITGDGTLNIRTTTADFLPGAVNTVHGLGVFDSTLNSPTPLTNLVSIGDSTVNAAVVNQGTLTIRGGLGEHHGTTSTINGSLTNAAGASMGIFDIFNAVNLVATQGFVNNGILSVFIASLTVTGGSLVNAPGATIRGGEGNLNATLDNQGTLTTTTGDIVVTGSLTNSGTINIGTQSGTGGDLTVNLTNPSAPFTNTGTITIGNLRAAIVEGGDFANAGTVTLVNFGSIVVTGNYTQTAGTTQLNNGLLTASLVDLEGGVLAGTGVINANVLNKAEVDVGQPGAPGTLIIVGDYTQTSGGDLVIEIGGPNAGTDFDQLNLTGQATLDGALTVNLINGFVPKSGDRFPILTFSSETGTFATLNGDGPLFTPSFDPTDVTLVAN